MSCCVDQIRLNINCFINRGVKGHLLANDSSKFTNFSQELKMTVDVAQLQSSFQASLLELGYTGNVGQLPSNLGQNEKLFGFVKAVTERLNRKHHLTSTETAEYEKLKESGATLEVTICVNRVHSFILCDVQGEALQEAVSRLSGSGGQRSSEAVSKEVEELKLQVASAKSHLSTLTAVKGKLRYVIFVNHFIILHTQ